MIEQGQIPPAASTAMQLEMESQRTSLSVCSASSIPSTPSLSPPMSDSSHESPFFSAVSSSEESYSTDEDAVLHYAIQAAVSYGQNKSPTKPSSPGLKFPKIWTPKKRPEPLPLSSECMFSPKSPGMKKLRKQRPSLGFSKPTSDLFPPSPPAPTSANSSSFSVPSISLIRRVTYQGPVARILRRPKHHSLPSIPSASYGASLSDDSSDDQSERPVKFQSPQISVRLTCWSQCIFADIG
jgi:hypothetical protein